MFRLIALTLVAFCFSINSHSLTMGEAINIAGKQRMLSQRIAQYYLLLGLQPETEKYQKRLESSVSEFQSNLDRLTAYDRAASIRGQLSEVELLWTPYKRITTAPVTKDNAAEMLSLSNKLLASAHKYVGDLQGLSNSKSAELVNVSGRQRMLSQRIAKNFLAYRWEVSGDEAVSALYEDLAEFEHMLNYLIESDVNTDKIAQKLQKTKGNFKFATKGFDGEMNLEGRRLIFVVTGTTDTMLYNMDEITKLYAEVLDSGTQITSR